MKYGTMMNVNGGLKMIYPTKEEKASSSNNQTVMAAIKVLASEINSLSLEVRSQKIEALTLIEEGEDLAAFKDALLEEDEYAGSGKNYISPIVAEVERRLERELAFINSSANNEEEFSELEKHEAKEDDDN